MSDRFSETTPTERAAIVTLALADGRSLSPSEIADLIECHISTAYRILGRLSRVIPLGEGDDGRWSLVRDNLNLNID